MSTAADQEELSLQRELLLTRLKNAQSEAASLLSELREIPVTDEARKALEQQILATAVANVQGILAHLRALGVDVGLVVTDTKSHQGKVTRATAGADAVDVTTSPVRFMTTAGMAGVPDAPSILTFIDGNPSDAQIAKLLYLGVPIAEICALKIDHAHMAASYFETAMWADAEERADKAAEIAKKKGLDYTRPENKHSKGIVGVEKFIEYNQAIAQATYIEPELFAELQTLLSAFKPTEDTMDMLAALTSKLNASDNLPLNTEEQRKAAAIRSMAVMPVIVGMINSRISGQEFKAPTKEELENFNYAENFCKMMGLPTDEASVEAMNLFLLLHLDHEMNASTTAVKGTMSADNRLWASLTSGVQTLHGKRHGGANFDVLQNLDRILALTLEEIQSKTTEELFNTPQSVVEERAVKEIDPELAAKKISAYLDRYDVYRKEQAGNPNMFLIPGIGHRVYKKLDPRANEIKAAYEKVIAGKDIKDPLFILAKDLEKQTKERGYGDKGLFPNVDFYSGLMLRQMGINPRMMTPLFAVGRTPGWVAQGIEHYSRAIVRPFQVYIGETAVKAAEWIVGLAKNAVDKLKSGWNALVTSLKGEPDETNLTGVTTAAQMLVSDAKKQARGGK